MQLYDSSAALNPKFANGLAAILMRTSSLVRKHARQRAVNRKERFCEGFADGYVKMGPRQSTIAALAAAAAVGLAASTPLAHGQEGSAPGDFDYYVLSLSWSPSFCEAAAERGPERVPQQQCGARPYSFVVHGLWPQFEHGFPERCQNPPPRLNREIVSSMLDLMPSPRLVYHEWDTHGTCAGLSPRAYFELVRKARAAVTIPAEFTDVRDYRTVAPQKIQEAFVSANPGATTASVTIACSGRRLSEVRLCLTKDLRFRDCEGLRRGACRRDEVVMPPMRGG